MDVIPAGGLPASSILWQPRQGVWVLTVVCKTTYALAPTEAPLAPEQDPIHEQEQHWEDDASRSLRAPGDLSPLKPTADVVLVGHAFAPGGAPVRSLVARLVVGDVDKSVEVQGDRAFDLRGELEEGPRFTRMPLRYERAAGGPETWNPVGMRRDARDRQGKLAVPNLQVPGTLVARPDDHVEPIGLGPLAAGWPPRLGKLGPGARAWSPRAQGPLPEDLDRAFFNEAPPDQRTAELRDNERIVLENLHPDHPHLVTSLPGVRPRAAVTGRPGPPQELVLRPDTLVIDTDRLVCTLTWRGQLQLAHAREPGAVVIALQRPGQRLTLDDVARAARPVAASALEGTMVLDDPGAAAETPSQRAALPFTATPAHAAPAPAGRPAAGAPQLPRPPTPARPPPLPPRAAKPPPPVLGESAAKPPPPPVLGESAAKPPPAIGELTLTLTEPASAGPVAVTPFRAAAPAAPAAPVFTPPPPDQARSSLPRRSCRCSDRRRCRPIRPESSLPRRSCRCSDRRRSPSRPAPGPRPRRRRARRRSARQRWTRPRPARRRPSARCSPPPTPPRPPRPPRPSPAPRWTRSRCRPRPRPWRWGATCCCSSGSIARRCPGSSASRPFGASSTRSTTSPSIPRTNPPCWPTTAPSSRNGRWSTRSSIGAPPPTSRGWARRWRGRRASAGGWCRRWSSSTAIW
ncbi:MAG: DUF2169 domain-containing protein [Minicystis sp.]